MKKRRASTAATRRYQRFVERETLPENAVSRTARVRRRTGKVWFRARGLAIVGIVRPFDVEVWFGALLCAMVRNGTGKLYFLRLLAGEDRRGADARCNGSTPSLFAQLTSAPTSGIV